MQHADTLNVSGTLFMVATPIGNLSDITLRALETLKAVDAILCEDTRVTSKLLKHYAIKKPTRACHEHTDDRELAQIVSRLKRGEQLAFVTDAGTPGLSDPGNRLVARALQAAIPVVPIPGVSALGALLSVAGIDMREFVFKGFPPHKKGRQTFFQSVATSAVPVLYYDSLHRVHKNLELLASLAPEKHIVLGRELTKMFETVVRGGIGDVLRHFTAHPQQAKGEFVVIAYTERKASGVHRD